MRNIKVGLAIALVGAMLTPLGAGAKDRRQDGVISGSAAGEAKQPYDKYIIRGRDTQSNVIAQTTTLDADAKFALNGLVAGTYMVELVRGAAPNGQGGKIVCTAGPFTLQESDSQVTDLMIKKGANVQCNRPMAAYYLLGAAAAAGVTAGVVGGTDVPTVTPTVTPTAVSGAQ
jgi:nitrous oxidase accessory protein NosD